MCAAFAPVCFNSKIKNIFSSIRQAIESYMIHSSCCAVFVSFNPDIEILENIRILIPQVAEILVVDNNSSTESISILRKLESEDSVTVIYNDLNLGIATALNQGVEYALQKGYAWLATFDQDSMAAPDYINTMMSAYRDCEYRDSVAVIAPKYQTATGIVSFAKNPEEKSYSLIKTSMTSGNLIDMNVFKSIGLFADSFFIDCVDHEFCLRVRLHNFSIIESQNSFLKHNLGNSTTHQILGVRIITTNHSALRRYYKYRNLIAVVKAYYSFEPLFLTNKMRALAIEPIKIVLFEENKIEKIKSIVKGVKDGLTMSVRFVQVQI